MAEAKRVSLRPFAAADLPLLQEIRRAAFRPVFASFRDIVGSDIAEVAFAAAETEQAGLLDEICAAGSAYRIEVLVESGSVAGFATYTLDAPTRVGEIGLNAVHPDRAGRGLGTLMYGLVLERMRAAGMAVATVSTGRDAAHAPARAAYRKAGFGRGIPAVNLYCRL